MVLAARSATTTVTEPDSFTPVLRRVSRPTDSRRCDGCGGPGDRAQFETDAIPLFHFAHAGKPSCVRCYRYWAGHLEEQTTFLYVSVWPKVKNTIINPPLPRLLSVLMGIQLFENCMRACVDG